MKHIVRAFVVVLVLTGAIATTQTSSASTQNKVAVAKVSMLPVPAGAAATTQTSSASTKNNVTVAKVSMLPVPMCAPDDPNACGMAQGR